ncbi:MAG: hypothetical protein ABSG76_23145 [Xanthobacteraceae bacterium]|jgi:hypothetical protein
MNIALIVDGSDATLAESLHARLGDEGLLSDPRGLMNPGSLGLGN